MEFLGFKENIWDYYAAFDLFLYPSLDEGLGSAVLDAFYFKLPVIATRVGGIPDMVDHEKNGILLSPGDEKGLSDQIVRMYEDVDLRENLGQAGRDSLSRFDIQTTAPLYKRLYARILKGKGIKG